jgi:hypothetical protein
MSWLTTKEGYKKLFFLHTDATVPLQCHQCSTVTNLNCSDPFYTDASRTVLKTTEFLMHVTFTCEFSALLSVVVGQFMVNITFVRCENMKVICFNDGYFLKAIIHYIKRDKKIL